MNMTYMDYLTESDRIDYITEKAINDEFEKLNILFEMCSLQQKIHEMDIENKVLEESGTYDDYAILLMEANQQVSEEKKGILAKIFDWFAKVFSSIHEKISAIFSKNVDPNKDVSAPAVFFDNAFTSLLGGVESLLNSRLAQALIGTTLGVVADKLGADIYKKMDELKNKFVNLLAAGGTKIVKCKVMQGMSTRISKIGDSINNFINKANSKPVETDSDVDKGKNCLQKLGDLVSGFVSKAQSTITNVVTGGNANQNQNNNQNQNGQNTNNNGNDQSANNTNNGNNQSTNTNGDNGQNNGGPGNNTGGTNTGNGATNTNNTTGNGQPPAGTESTGTYNVSGNELTMYESIFGKLENDDTNTKSDILDILDII